MPKTRKNKKQTRVNSFEREIVAEFLTLLQTVKLYHWKTKSFAVHKATDELYSKLNESIDSFVEILLGKFGNRVEMKKIKTIPVLDCSSLDEFKEKIEEYKSYLVDLDENPVMLMMSNTDLFNIRDEMLGELNQFLYLSTFQ
jgi:DNA-binding ferritin-like protein